MSFASTELDKRRRSTEGGDTTASCNTSPDSGIGHGDPPPAPQMQPGGKKGGGSQGGKSPRLFKTPATKMSPGRESPPPLLVDESAGPPRTPSPSSSVDEHNVPLDGPYSPAHPLESCSPPPSIPVKYQRTDSEHRNNRTDHHFKKKFFYRDNMNSNWQQGSHHKGKFRPKGKDWEWHSKQQTSVSNIPLPPPYLPHARYRYGPGPWDQDHAPLPGKYS